jgi:hypothetical protein
MGLYLRNRSDSSLIQDSSIDQQYQNKVTDYIFTILVDDNDYLGQICSNTRGMTAIYVLLTQDSYLIDRCRTLNDKIDDPNLSANVLCQLGKYDNLIALQNNGFDLSQLSWLNVGMSGVNGTFELMKTIKEVNYVDLFYGACLCKEGSSLQFVEYALPYILKKQREMKRALPNLNTVHISSQPNNTENLINMMLCNMIKATNPEFRRYIAISESYDCSSNITNKGVGLACSTNNLDIIKLLFKYCDNMIDNLKIACIKGNILAVRYIMEHMNRRSTSSNRKNILSKSPYPYIKRVNVQSTNFIVSAMLNHIDNHDRPKTIKYQLSRCLQLACKHDNLDIYDYLHVHHNIKGCKCKRHCKSVQKKESKITKEEMLSELSDIFKAKTKKQLKIYLNMHKQIHHVSPICGLDF